MSTEDLNDDPQVRGDLTPEQQREADVASASAFEGGFQTDDGHQRTAAAAPEQKDEAADAPSKAAVNADDDTDPFAKFGPKVRELFAKIPEIEQENRSLRGRVPNLQRENEDLKRRLAALESRTPEPAAAPPSSAAKDAVDKVRGELPEVADAIEMAVREAFERTPAPPPQAPAAPAVQAKTDEDGEAAILAQAHADWAPTMNSTEFKLWIATQPENVRSVVMSTDKAAPVVEALSKFKEFKTRAAPPPPARSDKRAAAAVTTRGNPAPIGDAEPTAEDAFMAGFNSGP